MARVFDYWYIAATIIFTVYGQLILKWRITELEVSFDGEWGDKWSAIYVVLTDPFVISGLGVAVLASITWMGAMSKFDLSYAYPFMSLNFVFVVLLSAVLFGEKISTQGFIGVTLIVLGTVILAK